MILTFYNKKNGKELESYDDLTSLNDEELQNIKRKIEKEYKTSAFFKINN